MKNVCGYVYVCVCVCNVNIYAMLNSAISPISFFASSPTLYDARQRSLTDSTRWVRLPVCQTSTSCVTPRLCLGARERPVWGLSWSS
jgi:hypothetical protein